MLERGTWGLLGVLENSPFSFFIHEGFTPFGLERMMDYKI